MMSTSLRRRGVAAACGFTLALAAGAAPAVDATELKFGQFFRAPVGSRGLEISATLRGAHGRRVRLVGYMVAQELPSPGRFMLTPRPVRMSEHADGDADDLPPATVTVHLAPSQQEHVVVHRDGLVALEGTLDVGRAEEADGRISWVRLQLDRDAVLPAVPPLFAQPGR